MPLQRASHTAIHWIKVRTTGWIDKRHRRSSTAILVQCAEDQLAASRRRRCRNWTAAATAGTAVALAACRPRATVRDPTLSSNVTGRNPSPTGRYRSTSIVVRYRRQFFPEPPVLNSRCLFFTKRGELGPDLQNILRFIVRLS